MSIFQGVLISVLSLFQGCPYFRGVLISGVFYFRGALISECPYFRGVLIVIVVFVVYNYFRTFNMILKIKTIFQQLTMREEESY